MNIWQRSGAVFLAMVALDVVFALYVIKCAEHAAVQAGIWAATIQVFNSFIVVSFVNDRRMVVPLVAGAFVGTWLAVVFL